MSELPTQDRGAVLYETQGASVHIHLVYSASYDFPRPSDLELHTQEKTTDSTLYYSNSNL